MRLTSIILCALAAALPSAACGARAERPTDEAAATVATTTGAAAAVATPAAAAKARLRPFSRSRSTLCLRSAGATVSRIRSTDARLRALGDLAQHTSLQVRIRGRLLGLAFGDAVLLAQLLQVPDDPYRLEVRRNVLLMFRPAARAEAAAVRRCLRT